MLKKVTMKKQPKITKMFRQAKKPSTDDCDDLEEEVRQLEIKLKQTHDKLFQIQRNKYRQKVMPAKKTDDLFIRPEKILLGNSVDSLNNDLELMTMLSGVEVQSYVAGDNCCIVYHMQHGSATEVKHGLRIEMNSDTNIVTKSSLPVGFNCKAVMEDYKNILLPECLCSIRNGLVAYYDRLDQYEALKNLLNIEAELFKLLDGSHIEVSFYVQKINEEDEQIPVKLVLDYRVYDIRPKTYGFEDTDLPDGMADTLKTQCVLFKKKPLQKAFKEAFMNGIGPYNLVQQLGVRQEKPKTKRQVKPKPIRHNNDDTFRPEDCSDQGEDFFEE